MILDAGRSTLELADPAQKAMIDRIEVGRPAAPRIRVAFEVTDAAGMTTTLVDAGAELIAAPVETPWRSLNSRLDAPAGLQITLFEELETLDERVQRPGFGEAATRDERADPARHGIVRTDTRGRVAQLVRAGDSQRQEALSAFSILPCKPVTSVGTSAQPKRP